MEKFERIRRVVTRFGQSLGIARKEPDLGSYAVPHHEKARMKANPPTEAHRAFFAVTNRPAHKWSHYLDVYERYMSRLRDKPIVMFEIGVLEGGSLEMWRNYLGPHATIVGIDINPACAGRVDAPNVVRIGSQADRNFLEGLVKEFGRPDVVLDDGSHIAKHQRASFDILFPHLNDNGLYMVEDAHTSYWNDWDGGYRRSGTAIEEAKKLIDDQHAWYHHHGRRSSAGEQIDAVHFHDSVIVIEKAAKPRPGMMSSHEA